MSYCLGFPAPPPLDVGQILGRTLKLVRGNLKVLVGISAAPPAIFYLMFAGFAGAVLVPLFERAHPGPPLQPQDVPVLAARWVPAGFFLFLIYWLILALALAAGAYAAVQADRGLPVTFGQAWRMAWERAGRHFLLLLLIYVICFFPVILIQIGFVISMGLAAVNKTQPGPIFLVLFPFACLLEIALFIAGFVVALRLSLAFPASVAENLTAMQSIRRSNQLSRGVRLKIFLVLLIIYAASYAAMLILMAGAGVVILIGWLAFSGSHLDPASPLFWTLGGIVLLALLILMVLYAACSSAGYMTALAVIYNDQHSSVPHRPDPARSGAPA